MHGRRQLDRSARDTDPARNVNDHGWGDRGDGQGRPGLSFGLRDREQVASVLVVCGNPEDGALRADPDCAVRADGCVATGVQSAGTARGPDAPASRSLAADPTEHCGYFSPGRWAFTVTRPMRADQLGSGTFSSYLFRLAINWGHVYLDVPSPGCGRQVR